jgi:hypothetical protein
MRVRSLTRNGAANGASCGVEARNSNGAIKKLTDSEFGRRVLIRDEILYSTFTTNLICFILIRSHATSTVLLQHRSSGASMS